MTVTVYCPHCTKQLKSPEDLVGKLVECPSCHQQFAISPQENGNPPPAASSMDITSSMEVVQQPNFYPPGTEPPKQSTERLAEPPVQSASSDNPQHRALGSGGGTKARFKAPPPSEPPTGNTVKFKSPPVGAPPTESAPPRTKPAPPPAAPPKPGPETPVATTQSPSQRQAKAAKFVAAGAVKSRINLGEDGQLPELVVQEGKETTKQPTEKSESSKSLLPVAALSVSVVLSLLVLLIPSGSGERATPKKEAARQQLKQYYIGKDRETLEPYQIKLRRALIARDEAEARQLYRDVLMMLRDETSRGLTSPVQSEAPPNDKDLEEQILILLRED